MPLIRCPSCGQQYLVNSEEDATRLACSQCGSRLAMLPAPLSDEAEPTPRDDHRPILIVGGVVGAILLLITVVAVVVVSSRNGDHDAGQERGLPWVDEAQEDTARAKAHEIGKALMTYYKDYDSYPADLTALTQKGEFGGPYLAADGLLDPWGQTYQFDPAGTTFNNGVKPDVWTEHGGKIIGNFPKK
jgi:hypothetical protein